MKSLIKNILTLIVTIFCLPVVLIRLGLLIFAWKKTESINDTSDTSNIEPIDGSSITDPMWDEE